MKVSFEYCVTHNVKDPEALWGGSRGVNFIVLFHSNSLRYDYIIEFLSNLNTGSAHVRYINEIVIFY